MITIEVKEREVKDRKELKILTLNNMLTKLLKLLAQIKNRNNSSELKNEIRQTIYLL